MSQSRTHRVLVATTIIIGFGFGCGSTGGGCGAIRPLPSVGGQPAPAPYGLPANQIIEGGVQARVTQAGMAKLTAVIPNLVSSLIGGGLCAVQPTEVTGPFGIHLADVCDRNDCSGGAGGCPAFIYLNSKDRPASSTPQPPYPPAPGNRDDHKDGVHITVNNSATSPSVTVDAAFDAFLPLHINPALFDACYLFASTNHLADDNADPLHVVANIGLTTNGSTGELGLQLNSLNIPGSIALSFSGSNGICSAGGTVLNAVLDVLNFLPDAIHNFILGALNGPLNNLVQSFLPHPLGLAGVADLATTLKQFNPPREAGLELYLVPGGSTGAVQTKNGGLTLGVMAGVNSDRDPTTRAPGKASEPSLCVPTRATPQLGQNPWHLPANGARGDFLLSLAAEFSGSPDPTDGSGRPQDVAIGLSRSFLDLVGFHIYNSGTLCLSIDGAALPMLNVGTLSILIPSLANLTDDNKAPLALALRPQQPLAFQVGAGSAQDPLLHILVNDLRIDFYAWIEERYARLFTLGVDLDVGVNLTFTKAADGSPAIQPMLVGLDAQHVTIRVSNTDLLQEAPASLAHLFPSLINLATSMIGGAIGPITLPAVAGFRLDELSVRKVHTAQDDFVGVFGNIVTGGPRPLSPFAQWLPNIPATTRQEPVRANAAVGEVHTPAPVQLQALFDEATAARMPPARPTVQLHLGAAESRGDALEWAWRIDGGMWRPWTRDPNPVVSDDAFLLQGRHVVEVRSRVVDQWASEDMAPVRLEVLIDSVAPTLKPARDDHDSNLVRFNGDDLVSAPAALQYAVAGSDGKPGAWSSRDRLTVAEVLAATGNGRTALTLFARDEAGNVGSATVALSALGLDGSAPRASGCSLGGAGNDGRGALVLVLAGLGLALLRRRRRALARVARRAPWLALLVAVGLGASACGSAAVAPQCKSAADCASQKCPPGQIPTCNKVCGCHADLDPGSVGRYASMTLINGDAYVAAYNSTYGDLMIGHVTPPAVVPSWDFVDGVPDQAPDFLGSHVRGGISAAGDDVGRYASIANGNGQPIIAYYDATNHALKLASAAGSSWHSHTVDVGGSGDDIGRWTSLTLGSDGTPAIAYTALVQAGTSGKPEGQLRWAQAKSATPSSKADWTVTVLDAQPLPAMAAGAPDPVLPPADIMAAAARRADGSPGVAWYDRARGNLRYLEFDAKGAKWGAPLTLDGERAGADTGDVGAYPSLAYDDKGVGHISYESASLDRLYYVNTMNRAIETVDDGYYPADEHTQDDLGSPVQHHVGDSSSIQVAAAGPAIAYQDSTAISLRLATRSSDGKWTRTPIAGHAMPFMGSYGFYANLRLKNGQGIVSSYAINQQMDPPAYFVQVFAVDLAAH